MRAWPLLRVAALIAATALLPGCTGASAKHATETTARPFTSNATARSSDISSEPLGRNAAALPCDQAIDTRAQLGSLHVVLGVVALPSSPGYQALQTARTGDPGPLRLFAKNGLAVKAGTSFQLVIPAPFSQHARIGWGSPGPTSREIVVEGCTAPGSGWLAFAGGYWVDHPACLPVIVRSNGRQQTVHIGVGTACPGQSPPAAPTES